MQFSKKFLVVALVLVISGGFVWGSGLGAKWFGNEETVEAQEEQGNQDDKLGRAQESLNRKFAKGKETAILVQADPVVKGELIQTVSAQGRVHAYQNIELVGEVSGILVELKVREGDRVKAGQVVARLDDRTYALAVKEAQANLLKARAEYLIESDQYDTVAVAQQSPDEQLAKLSEQYDKGLISEEDYRAKKLELELQMIRSGSRRDQIIEARTVATAEVALERAKLDLEKTEIRAPFDGVVYELEVAKGRLLNSGTKLFRLVNMSDLVIKAQVLESEIGQIFEGRPVQITFTALKDLEPITGKVRSISPLVNSEDKTVETLIAFKSNDRRIRPGMFSDVVIDAEIHADTLMVPKAAILPRDNRKVVFKIGEDDRAKWLYVETGIENAQFVEITNGDLKDGDLVLTDNHFTMGHDTLVQVDK
jgi:RND family efflux transporter MFP subunit